MVSSPKVRTCLWFEKDGLEAAKFYVSLLPDSHLETDPESDAPMDAAFTLAGAPYQILNGGPMYPQTEAASISVSTVDQNETDRLWNALTTNGGSEGRCGWLKDRWGVSWQIVPKALPALLGAPDRAAADRAVKAMMGMTNINIAELERTYRGE